MDLELTYDVGTGLFTSDAINQNPQATGGYVSSSSSQSSIPSRAYINGVLVAGSLTSTELGLQDKLVAGNNINITGNTISASIPDTIEQEIDYNDIQNLPKINGIELKGNTTLTNLGIQGKLTAGNGININGNVISATGQSVGTVNYNELTNKPKLNGVELTSNTNIPIQSPITVGEGLNLTNNVLTITKGDVDTTDYNELTNKPSIAGTTLQGNVTLENLDIQPKFKCGSNLRFQDIGGQLYLVTTAKDKYADLSDKPSINGVQLNGNKSSQDLGINQLQAGSGIDITNNVVSVNGVDYNDLTNKPRINGKDLDNSTTLQELGVQPKLQAGNGVNIVDNTISVSLDAVSSYNDLTNLPKINSIVLGGNQTGADLLLQDKLIAGNNISITGNVISAVNTDTRDYTLLTNLPKINGNVVTGNLSTSDLGIQPKLHSTDNNIIISDDGNISINISTLFKTGANLSLDYINGEYWLNTTAIDSYADLSDKPSINGVSLSGDLSLVDLGIQQDWVLNDNGVKTLNEYTYTIDDGADYKLTMLCESGTNYNATLMVYLGEEAYQVIGVDFDDKYPLIIEVVHDDVTGFGKLYVSNGFNEKTEFNLYLNQNTSNLRVVFNKTITVSTNLYIKE